VVSANEVIFVSPLGPIGEEGLRGRGERETRRRKGRIPNQQINKLTNPELTNP